MTSKIRPALVALALCLPAALSAGTILTPVTITIPTRNLHDAWILCTVPANACSENSPTPLIHVEAQEASLPPISAVADIVDVQTAIVKSGYITWFALDASDPDHLVIGLRNGVVDAGDPWPFPTPETTLVAALQTGGPSAIAELRSFFLSNLTAFPQVGGTGGTFYRFSNAVIVGSIGPTVITPEPQAGALVAATLLAFAVFRSRRSALR